MLGIIESALAGVKHVITDAVKGKTRPSHQSDIPLGEQLVTALYRFYDTRTFGNDWEKARKVQRGIDYFSRAHDIYHVQQWMSTSTRIQAAYVILGIASSIVSPIATVMSFVGMGVEVIRMHYLRKIEEGCRHNDYAGLSLLQNRALLEHVLQENEEKIMEILPHPVVEAVVLGPVSDTSRAPSSPDR